MEIDPVKFGVTWQKVEAMEFEVAELRKDVKALLVISPVVDVVFPDVPKAVWE